MAQTWFSLMVLVAAPLAAQTPSQDQIKKDAAALAAAKAAAAPVAVSAKPMKELMECLLKRGSPNIRPTDILHIVQKSDAPSSSVSRDITMGLAEAPPDPKAGRIGDEKSMYYDLLERHTYTHYEMQTVSTKKGKDGKGEIESIIYYLSLDNKLYDVLLQKGPGAFDAKGGFVPDAAQLKTYKVTPASGKPGWESLAPYLALLCSSIEV